MGQIKNKSRYKVKQNPSLKDYFIGSDNSKNGETVNFEIGSIVSLLNTVGQQDRIISGTPIWIAGTLSFYIPEIVYILSNRLYSTEPITITLDDGGLQPRIDVIAVTNTGEVYVQKGTESPSPQKPTLPNGTDYLELTFVNIAAFGTTPTGASVDLIYDDNTGEPTEYTATESTGGNGIILGYTPPDPLFGTKVIRLLRGTIANGTIDFTNDSLVTFEGLDYFQMALLKHEEFNSNIKIEVSLFKGLVEVSNKLTVNNSIFGFDNGIVDQYQFLTIPLSKFSVTDSEYDRVQLKITNIPTTEVFIDRVVRVIGLNLPATSEDTDLGYIPSPTSGTITSSTGNSAIVPLVDSTNSGLMSPTDKNKLDSFPSTFAHHTTHESGGTDAIDGDKLKVTVVPPTSHYTPITPDLKGHLQGIDQVLGTIGTTTAGITNRIYFTGVPLTISAGTFYTSSALGKGAVSSVIQTVSNNDNEKKYFTQDVISVAQTASSTIPAGNFTGQLTVGVSVDSAQQRYTIEIYKTDVNGVPVPSGITGAPVGSLGVTVIAILDSGLINLVADNITNISLSGLLASDLSLNVNDRIRYRVSAEKVGTTGGAITMSLYYGSNYNSFYDVPVITTTDTVINRSIVTGSTTTAALNYLLSNKQDTLVSGVNIKTIDGNSILGSGDLKLTAKNSFAVFDDNFEDGTSGLTLSTGWSVGSDGIAISTSGGFGNSALYSKVTTIDRVSTRAVVQMITTTSVFSIIRKPTIYGSNGTVAEVNGSLNQLRIYAAWDGGTTAPAVAKTITIPFAIKANGKYLVELTKDKVYHEFKFTDLDTPTNTVTLVYNQFVEGNSGDGRQWGSAGVMFISGSIKLKRFTYASMFPINPKVLITGHSFVEGYGLFTEGDLSKTYSNLLYDDLRGSVAIAGRGGDTVANLISRDDTSFYNPIYHLVDIGSNDTVYATWLSGMQTYIASILLKNSIPVLCTIVPRSDRQAFINQANAWIRTSGYNYVDFAKAVTVGNDGITQDPALFASDAVHPNTAGNAKMFQQLKVDAPYLWDGAPPYSVDLSVNEVVKTTSFTVSNSERFKTYVINSSSAVVVTVPTGLTAGFWWEFISIGTGAVSFVTSGGSTIISPDSRLKLRTQNSQARIFARASNQVALGGDIVL